MARLTEYVHISIRCKKHTMNKIWMVFLIVFIFTGCIHSAPSDVSNDGVLVLLNNDKEPTNLTIEITNQRGEYVYHDDVMVNGKSTTQIEEILSRENPGNYSVLVESKEDTFQGNWQYETIYQLREYEASYYFYFVTVDNRTLNGEALTMNEAREKFTSEYQYGENGPQRVY